VVWEIENRATRKYAARQRAEESPRASSVHPHGLSPEPQHIIKRPIKPIVVRPEVWLKL
jgi:hypothetical protein